ncbi:unnamed protein product [Paramecium sonneborni]|uniref:Transmembrane protein n=1 Tax=Paramecium sonneborni TaxID=65129 RepID=A0A8S1P5J0_9CILI|nr:unnamed protein product [Paramecium sonneborni]
MNLDNHNANEHKQNKKHHYYDQDWPQQQFTLLSKFTPQQSVFNFLPDQEIQDKNKSKYPLRKLSIVDTLELQKDDPNHVIIHHLFNYISTNEITSKQLIQTQIFIIISSFLLSTSISNILLPFFLIYTLSKFNQLLQYQKVSHFQCNCKKSKYLKTIENAFQIIIGFFQSWNCTDFTEQKNKIDHQNKDLKLLKKLFLKIQKHLLLFFNNNRQQLQIIQATKKVVIVKNLNAKKIL